MTIVSQSIKNHIPIVASAEKNSDFIGPDRHTYVNYNKANWADFGTYIEKAISQLPAFTFVRRGEKAFRTIVLTAAKIFIPAGRIPNIRPN